MPETSAQPPGFGGQVSMLLAAAFAVQRLVELLDPLLFTADTAAPPWRRALTRNKASWSGLLSTAAGCALSYFGQLNVLHQAVPPSFTDVLVTGLAIGAGTNGVNSVLKFAQYSKDSQRLEKADVLARPVSAPPTAVLAKSRSQAS